PWSRGEFDFNGNYTDIPNNSNSNTGIANFLLTPAGAANGGTVGFLGGPTQIYLSNISLTDNGKNYYGVYGNDDIKLTRKLTVNLGLRWDFFGLVYEHHGNQANFIPSGGPLNGPTYLMPGGKNSCDNTFVSVSFTTLLAQDGIKCLATDAYGGGLAILRRTILHPGWASPIKLTPSWWCAADSACSTTALKTAGFRPTSARTIPSSSISLTETAVVERPQFPLKSPPTMWAVPRLPRRATLRPLSPAFHATHSVHFRFSHPGCRYVESNTTTRLLTP